MGHATIEQRLDYIEKTAGHSVEDHAKQLLAARNDIQSLHAHVAADRSAREKHHSTVEQRVQGMEESFGTTVDKHARSVQALQQNLDDVLSQLNTHTTQRNHMEDRIAQLEANRAGSAAHHAAQLENVSRTVQDFDSNLSDTKLQVQNLSAAFRSEMDARDSRHASVDARLKRIETGAVVHTREVQATAQRLHELHGHVADEQKTHETYRLTAEDRLKRLEAGNNSPTRPAKDSNLESSILERLRNLEMGLKQPPKSEPLLGAEGPRSTPAAPGLGKKDMGFASSYYYSDRDFFRNAAAVVIQDDGEGAPLQAWSSPKLSPPAKGVSKVTSLPSLR